MTNTDYAIYALLWLSFGLVHSWLASHSAKRLLNPIFGPAYRFCYNLFSALHVAAIFIVGQLYLAEHAESFHFSGSVEGLLLVLRFLGIAVMLAALTQYDLGLFGGLAQLRQGIRALDETETLHLGGMHRYVRHPIYLGAYCFLWGGVLDEFGLQTAIWGSVYLFIGTWFEERKLIAQYGQSYIEYRQKVPSILPFRGRAI